MTQTKRQAPYQFFYIHAGYSYDPATETPEQGKARDAKQLAKAERRARHAGASFKWMIDSGASSADWIADNEDGGKNREPWEVWCCVMYDEQGTIIASLHGIDFGRDKQPWGNPYRRVVEAELAFEAYN